MIWKDAWYSINGKKKKQNTYYINNDYNMNLHIYIILLTGV